MYIFLLVNENLRVFGQRTNCINLTLRYCVQIQHSDGTIFSGTWVNNVIVGGGTMTFEVGRGLHDGPTKVITTNTWV